MEYWLAALGLMLVLEGIMPFLFPTLWRQTLGKLAQLQDGQMRFVGLTLMLGGLLLIFWMN
ncbi:MAG: hypothetical protein FD173_1443 [Gallionellaceae bacterium]|nr:MAG: hypothetical protein FD173_1443 [Gallionellaceae bacterium]